MRAKNWVYIAAQIQELCYESQTSVYVTQKMRLREMSIDPASDAITDYAQ